MAAYRLSQTFQCPTGGAVEVTPATRALLAVTDTASGACDSYSMSPTSDTRLYYVDSVDLVLRGGCPDLQLDTYQRRAACGR
jgi:hypothetical protein